MQCHPWGSLFRTRIYTSKFSGCECVYILLFLSLSQTTVNTSFSISLSKWKSKDGKHDRDKVKKRGMQWERGKHGWNAQLDRCQTRKEAENIAERKQRGNNEQWNVSESLCTSVDFFLSNSH